MSSADKAKLNGIAAQANAYVLPTASYTVKGGVQLRDKIGDASDVTSGIAATPLAVKKARESCTGINQSKISEAYISGSGETDQYFGIVVQSIKYGRKMLAIYPTHILLFDVTAQASIGRAHLTKQDEEAWTPTPEGSNVWYRYRSGILTICADGAYLPQDWVSCGILPFRHSMPGNEAVAALVGFDSVASNNVAALYLTKDGHLWMHNGAPAGKYSGTLSIPADRA